jgi:hypothetical protein
LPDLGLVGRSRHRRGGERRPHVFANKTIGRVADHVDESIRGLNYRPPAQRMRSGRSGFRPLDERTCVRVQVCATGSTGSHETRGTRARRSDPAGDRARSGPLHRDPPILASALEHRPIRWQTDEGRPRDGAARGHASLPTSRASGLPARRPRHLPVRSMRPGARRRATPPDQADSGRGGRRLLCVVRIQPIAGSAAVPSPQSRGKVVRTLLPRIQPRDRSSPRRGPKVRAPLRKLPRRSGGWSAPAGGSPGWIRTTKN